jgi:uncharacterized protein (TIGR02453 family)
MHFSGFPLAGLDFLTGLKQNNTREWFGQNKAVYENNLKQPAQALIAIMDIRFHELELPYRADSRRSLFRIHRDTRFSKDKSPYKTNLGISFDFSAQPTQRGITEKPGLYLHIEPGSHFVAGGLYMPASPQLKSIRLLLDTEWEILEQALHYPLFQEEFPNGLQGEKLRNIPKGFEQDHPAAEYLKLKQFLVSAPLTDDQIRTEEIIDILERKAMAMAPLLDFLSSATDGQQADHSL